MATTTNTSSPSPKTTSPSSSQPPMATTTTPSSSPKTTSPSSPQPPRPMATTSTSSPKTTSPSSPQPPRPMATTSTSSPKTTSPSSLQPPPADATSSSSPKTTSLSSSQPPPTMATTAATSSSSPKTTSPSSLQPPPADATSSSSPKTTSPSSSQPPPPMATTGATSSSSPKTTSPSSSQPPAVGPPLPVKPLPPPTPSLPDQLQPSPLTPPLPVDQQLLPPLDPTLTLPADDQLLPPATMGLTVPPQQSCSSSTSNVNNDNNINNSRSSSGNRNTTIIDTESFGFEDEIPTDEIPDESFYTGIYEILDPDFCPSDEDIEFMKELFKEKEELIKSMQSRVVDPATRAAVIDFISFVSMLVANFTYEHVVGSPALPPGVAAPSSGVAASPSTSYERATCRARRAVAITLGVMKGAFMIYSIYTVACSEIELFGLHTAHRSIMYRMNRRRRDTTSTAQELGLSADEIESRKAIFHELCRQIAQSLKSRVVFLIVYMGILLAIAAVACATFYLFLLMTDFQCRR